MVIAEYFYVLDAVPGCWSCYFDPNLIPVSIQFLKERAMSPRDLVGTDVREVGGEFVGILGSPTHDTFHGKWIYPIVRPPKRTEMGGPL